MAALRHRRRPAPWVWLAFAPFLVSLVVPVLAGSTTLPTWYGLVPLAGAILGIGAIAISFHVLRAAEERASRALARWGAPRGLAWKAGARPEAGSCLLLDRSDAVVTAALRGRPAGARTGWVAHVGLPVRRWKALFAVPLLGPLAEQRVDDWTVVQVALRAAEARRYGRLVLSRRDLLDLGALRDVRDALTPLRTIELESAELTARYALLVADEADDVELRARLTPAFIVFLLERAGDALLVEVRGRTLSIGVRGRAVEPADLDRALEDARTVALALAPAIGDEEAPPAVALAEPPAARLTGLSLVLTAVLLGGILVFAIVVTLTAGG